MKVLLLGAPWCQACKTLRAALDRTPIPEVDVEYVDIDQHPDVAKEWHVSTLPTIVIPDRKIAQAGIVTVSQLRRFVEDLL